LSGKPKEGARNMIKKYGLPNEATPSMLIWYNNGPWNKTIVHKEAIPHIFPKPHPQG
jgi:transposase